MLFAGYFLDRNGNGANMWLVKTDSLGCDTPGCHNIGLEELLQPRLSNIELYPNPAKDQVSLSFNPSILTESKEITVQILNLKGKLVRFQTIQIDQSDLSIDVAGLPSGAYILEVFSDKGKLGYTKLVIE